MPKLQLTAFEPIEIEIVGQGVFKIEVLSSKMLGDLQVALEVFGQNPDERKAADIAKMLVKMLPGITLEGAMEIDIRHVVHISEFLAKQITLAAEPGEGKN